MNDNHRTPQEQGNGGRHLVAALGPDGGRSTPFLAVIARGKAAPVPRPQSNEEFSSGNIMAAAKMFRPEPFPMKGANFERVVKALEGHARSTYNVLRHFNTLSLPRRWEDRLAQRQKAICYLITKPEEWCDSGAAGEFVSSVQAVPVLAVHLVRRLNILKFFSIATYSGRVAIFSIRALEKVCQWQETVELPPPEVRTWLLDPDVAVVTSGERRTFLTKFRGIEVNNHVDTERIFRIYQEKGVIRPTVKVEKGDLSWQLAFAIGYHASPSHKNTWEQLVGEVKFKTKDRDWPEWRMPGWQPDSFWKLDEQESFFLYYNALGPLMFVNRLLRHGLTYGGLDAVATNVPLRECYLIFLQGAMEEPEMTQSNPLGLQSDCHLTNRRDTSSPAVRLYNPKYEHLCTPLEKAEAKRARMAAFQEQDESELFPEPPSSTTGALGAASALDGGDGEKEEGELSDSVEIVEEEEEAEEPLQIYVGEEDLSLVETDNNNNAAAPNRQRDGNNNNAPASHNEKDGKKSKEESPADPPRSVKDDRLPKKGRKACRRHGGPAQVGRDPFSRPCSLQGRRARPPGPVVGQARPPPLQRAGATEAAPGPQAGASEPRPVRQAAGVRPRVPSSGLLHRAGLGGEKEERGGNAARTVGTLRTCYPGPGAGGGRGRAGGRRGEEATAGAPSPTGPPPLPRKRRT